jgi:transposase
VTLSAANVAELHQLEPTLEAVAPLKRPGPGRPVKRPAKLHADQAYDARWCRQACRRRGIRPRIARRGVESSQRLGRHRWVVERTLAWLRGYRRLRIRDERRADIHLCEHALFGFKIFETYSSRAPTTITAGALINPNPRSLCTRLRVTILPKYGDYTLLESVHRLLKMGPLIKRLLFKRIRLRWQFSTFF